ncbi:hypothetical protein AM1_D0121 (plasmid) [Acaryochloris marina MBIC11017]|uniref:Uncharacterized protein n=1 Tax=Acaryochloris marina (strain MBIC 11017) TaxID=329726 RepID=A8ZNN0_ACAM1|nr:hypothetical protein AM1_D0121 [Acaryochloris marina MBIC11017]
MRWGYISIVVQDALTPFSDDLLVDGLINFNIVISDEIPGV